MAGLIEALLSGAVGYGKGRMARAEQEEEARRLAEAEETKRRRDLLDLLGRDGFQFEPGAQGGPPGAPPAPGLPPVGGEAGGPPGDVLASVMGGIGGGGGEPGAEGGMPGPPPSPGAPPGGAMEIPGLDVSVPPSPPTSMQRASSSRSSDSVRKMTGMNSSPALFLMARVAS